ncbi:Similar to phosphoglycolate phosphatase, clustered with ribosomal large subunit pseudouridine synthase C [hydrothermal vent metagenome]|uniref:Similar to phosphoglycolate phosphatase, clustered with ribosomal large subunit pseudouridine synthase C n=1 Tax=hydrothermal vent metagenome TaxID=652676 RepID=A0A3B0YVZ3_9ZZZZ
MVVNKEIMPHAIRLIVFDWDGTLMDSETQIVHAIFSVISDMRLEPRSVDECRNIIGLGLKEAIDSLYPGRDEPFNRQFVDCYRHHWFSQVHNSDLFPGARETVMLLREAGFELAVATGKGRPGLDAVLQQTGLEALFSVTRCADEARSKPHPQMLEEILEQTGIPAAQTLMVGDTEYDMGMAVQAGVHPVAVSYGVHERERLLRYRPLVCLDTISELVDWLAEKQLLDTGFMVEPPLLVVD